MTQEFTHDFMGYGRVPSTCMVRMYTDDGDTFFCFIDIGKGTSVTNASEKLATDMVNKFILRPEDCRFFETYSQHNYDSFDEIEYDWKPRGSAWEAEKARWRPADIEHKDLFLN